MLQYAVHDPEYPRNRRVREFLSALPEVVVATHERSRSRSRARRIREDLTALFVSGRRSDVILLSEMRLTQALPASCAARLFGARLIVDGFIGLHETAVGDWQHLRRGSLRARRLRLLDALAVRVADLYLIDTEMRAESIRSERSGAAVLSLPVGAPAWARPTRSTATGPLRILYYGNYIPLHGLDLVMDALDLLAVSHEFEIDLVGSGSARPALEQRAREAVDPRRYHFSDPIPEGALAEAIHRADVVLGVFGESEKAGGVVANKVWQGLACGRAVVTRDSSALDEIASAAGPLLHRTIPGSAESLAETLAALALAPRPPVDAEVAARLEAVVARSYDRLADWLVSDAAGEVAS
ncbi:hypothetical protein GCM10025780_24750 [Frondihabitans cladoniiphilus]|uniref:Glycosyltransferase involved in cell wall biosynthesis n=1 Tax=Frondihabitans cladoniiphilus TaxID=715785 RepID=A0ABP8W2C5_9MICO